MNAKTRNTARSDVMDRLADLGFTNYEALAYLSLLDAHPATAYEISKRGALTKANVYTALASLVEKGAVQPVSSEPVRYAPVDPAALFGTIAKSTAAICKDLASALTTRERRKALDYVWIIAGEERLHDKIVKMIEAAQQQIWIKAAHHLLEPHVESLKAAMARGVELLVILFGGAADAKRLGLGARAQLYLHEGSGDMLAVGSTQFVLAADWGDTLIADFAADPQGAYTRSQPVVFMAETMIRHEVYLAEVINAFGPEIEKRFGKDLLSLRQKYLPAPLLREFRRRTIAKERPRLHARASAPQPALVRR